MADDAYVEMHNEMADIAETAREHYFAHRGHVGHIVASAAFQAMLSIEADTEVYRYVWIGAHGKSEHEAERSWMQAKTHRDEGDNARVRAIVRLLEWMNLP